jgi:hypothetical protein
MNKEPTAAPPQPLRIATLLMAAAVMVGGTGCITASLIDSAQRASGERARKARAAEIVQRAEQKKRAELPAQPE